jgi:hypothetical protein
MKTELIALRMNEGAIEVEAEDEAELGRGHAGCRMLDAGG